MSMTVRRWKDEKTPSVFIHKVADIRGGISIKTSNLGGNYVYEGTPVTAPKDGICEIIKTATLAKKTTSTEKSLSVTKHHNFLKGDKIVIGEVTADITDIDTTAKGFDVLTLSATVGSVNAVDTIVAEPTTNKKPFAIIGTTKGFSRDSNLDEDAWVIGVTKGNKLPSAIAGELNGIINYD